MLDSLTSRRGEWLSVTELVHTRRQCTLWCTGPHPVTVTQHAIDRYILHLEWLPVAAIFFTPIPIMIFFEDGIA
jgi:hypothetical protein